MPAWGYILMPIAAVFGLAVTHVGLLRLFRAIRPYPAYGFAFLLWLCVELACDFGFAATARDYGWFDYGPANVLGYVILAYCYFHFFNLGETGRRMRLILELDSVPEGLSEQELARRYGAKEIMERRIQRLLDGGQMREQNDRFYPLGEALSSIAGVIAALRLLVMGGAGPRG